MPAYKLASAGYSSKSKYKKKKLNYTLKKVKSAFSVCRNRSLSPPPTTTIRAPYWRRIIVERYTLLYP